MQSSILLISKNEKFITELNQYLLTENSTLHVSCEASHYKSDYDMIFIYSEMAPAILYEIRTQSNVPVIVIDNDQSLVCDYLDAGADDFMVYPVNFKELSARTRAVIKRSRHFRSFDESEIRFDNLVINKDRYDVRVGGKVLSFSSREFEILYLLASNPNRVFTRDEILTLAFGKEYDGDMRTVDVHIKKIRDKLGNPSYKWDIRTVRGVGYKFSAI